jgi:hypothetical protein
MDSSAKADGRTALVEGQQHLERHVEVPFKVLRDLAGVRAAIVTWIMPLP